MSKVMTRKNAKTTSQKLTEPHQVSPELRAGIERFARALGHLILVKIDPEAVRRIAEKAV